MAIWTGVLLVPLLLFALSTATVRRMLFDVIKAFCHWRILTLVGFMMLYTAAMVVVLYASNLWNVSLLKETILWFCFVAPVLLYRFTSSQHNENVVSSIVADNVKIIVLFEFLVNTYTLSLSGELILIPVVSIIALLDAVAQMNEELAPLASLTTKILAIIGFGVLFYAVWQAVSEYRDLWTINTFHSIILAPLLSILFAPAIYAMLLYMEWELNRKRTIHRSS